MREAKIIVPDRSSDGRYLPGYVRSRITLAMLDAFGGYTENFARGAWRGPDQTFSEPVSVYTIAMEPTKENDDKLKIIAEMVRALAEQESVYYVTADGEVHFHSEPVEIKEAA